MTPRAVAAFRFFTGINTFVANAGDPARLRNFVETLSFGHMYLDITVPRVNMILAVFVLLFFKEKSSQDEGPGQRAAAQSVSFWCHKHS